jgi:hypothetical protein
MSDNAIRLEIRGATLLAVPAVHFRLPFAEAVNDVCRDPSSRPDAIAVELGPAATAAARAWLRELGVGPEHRRRLPCMLGLHRDNQLLHPAMRERALTLQRETGRELHRLPPALLQEELGFTGLAVMQLSPTDSIVEALRCACELNVPVYGVDLEISARSNPSPVLMEEPWLARGAIRDYAERNGRRALSDTDPLIDGRREAVMAARLLAVLVRHRRVLFTCGLGHWVRLAGLLQDSSLAPATIGLDAEDAEVGAWRRTLVHPGIAVQSMEWPTITWLWERNRPHPLRATPGKPHPPSCHEALLGKALEHVYTRTPGASREQGGQDWRALGRFTHLLAAEMQLTLRRFPNLGLVMRCAEAALPKPFSDALGRALTRFPWAKPARFPDTEQLLDNREGKEGDVTLSGRGRPFRAGLVQGGAILVPNPGLVRIAESHWESHRGSDGSAWSSVLSWRPWERLATALSAQASGHVRKRQRVRVTESFTGQLLDGIDVRRTLRESARGPDRLMVRDSRLAPTRTPTSMTDAFPVVWVFDTGGPRRGEMTVLRTPLTWLLHAGRDRAALEERRDGAGENMADLVLFTDDRGTDLSGSAARSGIWTYLTRGWLLFRPQCPSLRQAADWILRTRSRLTPIYSDAFSNALPMEFRHALARDGGPCLADLSWQDRLLRVGLAFGGRTLTLVAPIDFSPASAIRDHAARRGQTIVRVPITAFSKAHVARVRRIEMVPGRVQGEDCRIVYDGHPGDVLGEPEDAYRELIPTAWRHYLW